ncbi:right-handed parallel beta-helix repeat-containing protein [candidate division KSB1 bacterium]|nr:right-handed parallel beta-helix repeat-containing protein [candidate division KSB1 bacterium]
MKLKRTPIWIVGLFCCLMLLPAVATAQPSGGPYGPIPQTYELPKVEGTIYYVAPDGKTKASGKTLDEPTTIEIAIERVKTGDAIILRGGVYRTGNLILNQGITMQPYLDEQPILKGTFVATEWQKLRFDTWKTSWSRLFPMKPQSWWRRDREGERTPQHRFNNDMVFVDGKFLQSAGWEGELDENSYYINHESEHVYIGVDPTDHLVEITAFDVAILRTTKKVHGKKSDGKGPTIRGIIFTQYAYRALEIEGTELERVADEAELGKEVVGTTLEHCTISYCSRVAGYFRGDRMTIRHCKISDTSTEGIYLISSADALLEKNIFTRNNIERITGYFPAAVKIFNQCYRVTCRDNLVIDHPYSNGIWYDVGNVDGVFVNNWVQDVGLLDGPFSTNQPWPSDNGFFFEISKGVTCVGNVFVNCDHGLWILNSSNARIYQNTFINSTACISRTARSAEGDHFGWHPASGPGVEERVGHIFVNNLMTGDENFGRPLFYVWQPAALCERVKDSQLKELDNNVYVRARETASYPMIIWSPAENEECQLHFDSLNGFHEIHPEFEAGSLHFANYNGPLFQSPDLGNYQVLNQFLGSEAAAPISDEVKGLLRLNTDASYIGAYPSLPK